MMNKLPIAVAEGDGIGPEIMNATLKVLNAAGAQIEINRVDIGEKNYLKGFTTGIDPKAWDIIRHSKAFLKSPITTPQGSKYKNLNTTIRTALDLYATIRPCVSYFPYIGTKHPEMDVVVVRESIEDLYTGIEYQQTPNVCTSIKIISRFGSEKIIRYAFEYAKRHGRKKVTAFIKDNIMKFSDGLFHQVFQEVAEEYPNILNESWSVDVGAAKLAETPEIFDVVVMPNLYGDIVSDIGAQIAGSIGLGSSLNIGSNGAMFEAIHGSAPRRAGQNIANPSGLILAATAMMDYIDQPEVATNIHNAWLKTIEEGIHTYDIYTEEMSKKKVGTKEFSEAVIQNLGKKPKTLKPVLYRSEKPAIKRRTTPNISKRNLIGIDVYIYYPGQMAEFFSRISHINVGPLRLKMIANRGSQVWPGENFTMTCIEQWRCRFISDNQRTVAQDDVIKILHAFDHIRMDVIKGEFLYTFDDLPGFSSSDN